MGKAYDAIKTWYDGYHFGNSNVFCPWDELNHCDKLPASPTTEPGSSLKSNMPGRERE